MTHDAYVHLTRSDKLRHMGPIEKALAINRNGRQYGTFAEIGAGQEVARFFFQAGLASHTIAKTISAYDMVFSDAIYGKEKSGRYVCEPRILKMLEKEYSLLIERLEEKRGASSQFFVFADTIATQSGPKKQSHGWLGLRYQQQPKSPSNDIILHVRLHDQNRLNQQEALGTLGVNLIYGAIYHDKDVKELVSSLMDNLKPGRIEIDLIRTEGPGLQHIDKFHLNLELLRKGLSPAVLFTSQGHPAQPSEVFFNRPLFLKRVRLDQLKDTGFANHWSKVGLEKFKQLCPDKFADHLRLIEVSLGPNEDLTRLFAELIPTIKKLADLGENILVSRFQRWVDLKSFLRIHSNQYIALNILWDDLHRIFNDKDYSDFEGGLVEGLGKLIGESNCVILVDNSKVQDREIDFSAPHRSLYNYFRDNQKLFNLY